MDSVTTSFRVLGGEATLVRKSDGTLVELEDLSTDNDLSNYYTKSDVDIRLAFKQLLLDHRYGNGSTLLASNLIRRLVAGDNVTITQDADGNMIIASTGGGSGIPASIATFESDLVTNKVLTQCNLGLGVTNGITTDIIQCQTIQANSSTANGATTVSLNGTQISQLYASSGVLGSSLAKAMNEFWRARLCS